MLLSIAQWPKRSNLHRLAQLPLADRPQRRRVLLPRYSSVNIARFFNFNCLIVLVARLARTIIYILIPQSNGLLREVLLDLDLRQSQILFIHLDRYVSIATLVVLRLQLILPLFSLQLLSLLPLLDLVSALPVELLLVHGEHGHDVGLSSHQLQQVVEALVPQPVLLLDARVGLQGLLPNEVDQDFDACSNEALELVNDHLLVRQHLHVEAGVFLVQIWVQDLLEVRVFDRVAVVLEYAALAGSIDDVVASCY